MATAVRFEDQWEIPLMPKGLEDFRFWALSDEFPKRGRIDYLDGTIEVDMSSEDFYSHGTLKTEIVAGLHRRVKRAGLGQLLTDSTRVSCPDGHLSVEPDVVFISDEALDSGRVRLVPKASGEPDRFVEVEGPPDLIVEIVSDASVRKDTERLPGAYFRAGVGEYWLADARGEELLFRIHHRGGEGFIAAPEDTEGFQRSAVLDRCYRLDRGRDPKGRITFDLREKTEL